MSSRDGSDRLSTLRAVPSSPSPVASDPLRSTSPGEVAYTIGDAAGHHHHYRDRDRDRDRDDTGGTLAWINSVAIGVLFIFLFVYLFSHSVDSSPPAVLEATLGPAPPTTTGPTDDGGGTAAAAALRGPAPPPPPPAPPPPDRRHATSGPPPPPLPPTPAEADLEFLFYYAGGHPLALDAGPDGAAPHQDGGAGAGDGGAEPPPHRARTFYLVESDGASPDGVREMGALRPADLASYQCCCYDKRVSVCQSAAPTLLPGYELACLLLYDEEGAGEGDDGEAWTLVVTLGREFAARHTYCRLGVQPVAARHRPDARARDRLYPHRRRTLPSTAAGDDESAPPGDAAPS